MSGTPSFAQLRIVCFALLFGMTSFAVVAAVLLQGNDGKGFAEEPLPMLDTVVVAVGAAAALVAFALRRVLGPRADETDPQLRLAARFRATITSIAALEGGSLFGIVTWLLQGDPVPGLVVAMVLLSIAIAMVPFRDPDATGA